MERYSQRIQLVLARQSDFLVYLQHGATTCIWSHKQEFLIFIEIEVCRLAYLRQETMKDIWLLGIIVMLETYARRYDAYVR